MIFSAQGTFTSRQGALFMMGLRLLILMGELVSILFSSHSIFYSNHQSYNQYGDNFRNFRDFADIKKERLAGRRNRY